MTGENRPAPRQKRGNPRGSGYERNADDWYVEPPWIVRGLLAAETFTGSVWDPCCGRGTIPRVCAKAGLTAIGTDLINRGFGCAGIDFLRIPAALGDNIICNPPYALIEPWVDKALALAKGKVAIFARLALLEGIRRREWFGRTPLARVLVCSQRVSCPPGELAPPLDMQDPEWPSGGAVAYAWFVWDHAHAGAPAIGWLPPHRELAVAA